MPPTDERSPVNLALVLDRSGSMSGDKIAKAREAFCRHPDEALQRRTLLNLAWDAAQGTFSLPYLLPHRRQIDNKRLLRIETQQRI